MIKINGITKDYGNQKGVFDVTLHVEKGEVFGFLGPNGAGKTTTIRNLLGFILPDKGSCSINGCDCYKDASIISDTLGYLAGEISFIDDMTGMELIDFIADMKRVKDRSRINELIEKFQLNPVGKVKKMSKGMKQKIGIICAFMNDPQVIILDEPTSGLDPLMQNKFVELILEEKRKGKTIFISSHIFEEIEKTCDRVAIIKDGKIISIEDIKTLKDSKRKTYIIGFATKEEADKYILNNSNNPNLTIVQDKDKLSIEVTIKGKAKNLFSASSGYDIVNLEIKVETLEDIFMHFYELTKDISKVTK